MPTDQSSCRGEDGTGETTLALAGLLGTGFVRLVLVAQWPVVLSHLVSRNKQLLQLWPAATISAFWLFCVIRLGGGGGEPRARARARVCVVSVIVKRPVLPPCAVDGRSRNPLYYYYLHGGRLVNQRHYHLM